MSTLGPVGSVVGAGIAGTLWENLRPSHFFYIACALGVIGSSIMCIPYYGACLAGRIINGFSIGLFSAMIPVCNRSYTPDVIAGMVGSIFSIWLNGGIFIAAILGFGFLSEWYYYYVLLFLLPGVLVLIEILVIVFHYNYETPVWYLSHN